MNIIETPLNQVHVITPKIIGDARGSFSRIFCRDELSAVIGERDVVQINHSTTMMKGAIRGMHFQYPPAAEMKIIRCVAGKVFDVALDLRCDSPTFLQHFTIELCAESGSTIVIPEGCAHGFQALEAGSQLIYLHSAFYTPAAESGLAYNDPALAIEWPLDCTEISDRDSKHPFIDEGFTGVRI